MVLDAGHGGHDRGALSPFGDEKDFALDAVGRLRRKLGPAGLKVVQSRNSDVFIPLEARPAMARKYPNAIFVSIHFNAARRQSAAGLEIFAIPPQGARRSFRRGAGHSHSLAWKAVRSWPSERLNENILWPPHAFISFPQVLQMAATMPRAPLPPFFVSTLSG